MAKPDPYWVDEHGRPLPKKPCPRCGANVGPMPLRVEHLGHVGWQPYTVQRYQSWCGHTQDSQLRGSAEHPCHVDCLH